MTYQSRLESYFGQLRRLNQDDVDCPGSNEAAPNVRLSVTVDGAPLESHHSNSDDDAPLVQRYGNVVDVAREAVPIAESAAATPIVDSHSRARYQVISASDSRAKRSKFEEEAEECSDCDEDDSDEDSFVCSDHNSDADDHNSIDDGPDLRTICAVLRNRRGWVKDSLMCPQCYRLSAAIAKFAAEIQAAVSK
jgi:hypothetical protein